MLYSSLLDTFSTLGRGGLVGPFFVSWPYLAGGPHTRRVFERFLDPSRRCVVVAHQVAVERAGGDRKDAVIIPNDILFGLLSDLAVGELIDGLGTFAGEAGGAMRSFAEYRSDEADRASASGPTEREGYSLDAVRSFEFAQREALDLMVSYVGPEHLLLGLLRLETGDAAEFLTGHGVTIEGARQKAVELGQKRGFNAHREGHY
jgi:hypothetical protein